MTNPVVEKVAKAMYLRNSENYDVWATMREMDKNVYREQAKAAIHALHGVMYDVPKVDMGNKLLWEIALNRIEMFIATGK